MIKKQKKDAILHPFVCMEKYKYQLYYYFFSDNIKRIKPFTEEHKWE